MEEFDFERRSRVAEESATALAGEDTGTTGGRVPAGEMSFLISPQRIVIMSVLSWGLYYFYWMYVTWKHFRDYTGETAYPVWHALTQLVPIYGLFRLHAHVRVYKELMGQAGVPTSLSPGWAVVIVIVLNVLAGQSTIPISGELTEGVAVRILVLEAVSVVILVGLLLHLQENLNAFWSSASRAATYGRVGVGEVVFAVIGVLAWADSLANAFIESYRNM